MAADTGAALDEALLLLLERSGTEPPYRRSAPSQAVWRDSATPSETWRQKQAHPALEDGS